MRGIGPLATLRKVRKDGVNCCYDKGVGGKGVGDSDGEHLMSIHQSCSVKVTTVISQKNLEERTWWHR